VFIAACMSLAISNTDRLAALKQDAERSGIRLLPPDINRSATDFSVERTADGKLAIRYALSAIKRVGTAAMEAVVAARGTFAFEDLADFASRVDPTHLTKAQLENLIKAGAFDRIEENRARVFATAETILRRAQLRIAEQDSGQIGLFGAGSNRPEPVRLPDVPDWAPLDRLAFEAEAIGFHLTAHPLDAYASALRRLGVTPANQIEAKAQAGVGRVKVAGTVVASKERTTRTGSRMAWIRVSDASGSVEVTCFSEVLSKSRDVLAIGSSVLFSAELKAEGEAVRITAQSVEPLDQAAAQAASSIRIWLRETAAVSHIRELLGRESGGKGRVILVPRIDAAQSVEIALAGGYHVTPRLAQALKVLPGVEQVEQV
jgi:DNA polymerase-3 subunit alpha